MTLPLSYSRLHQSHGADDRDRTGDLVLTKDALYQLSYIGQSFQEEGSAHVHTAFLLRKSHIFCCHFPGTFLKLLELAKGFEPPTL